VICNHLQQHDRSNRSRALHQASVQETGDFFVVASWYTQRKAGPTYSAFRSLSGFIRRFSCPITLNGLFMVAALIAILMGCGAESALAANTSGVYTAIPAPEGGDILSVYSVHGPSPQSFWADVRIATRGDSQQAFRSTNVTFVYGLHSRASVGVTATHYMQDLGYSSTGMPINKQGAGDTRIFLKWAAAKNNDSPFMMGFCPSMRIPTGYDLEGDGLKTFTSRTNDFEFLGLLAYETPNVGVYLNPGISLPGGEWNNELLGGFGLDIRGGLPFRMAAKAEYTTRYDIVEDDFNHVIFASVRRPVMFGVSLEAGIKRTLLMGIEPSTELSFGLSSGAGRYEMPSIQLAPRESYNRILIAPVTSHIPDPHGHGQALKDALISELTSIRGISPVIKGGADYIARIEILNIKEGTGRSLSIPKLLATPQAVVEINAYVSIADGNGHLLMKEMPVSIVSKRGMGLQILPSKSNDDTWVPTRQTRTALLATGMQKMAHKITEEVVRVASSREMVHVITPEGGR
jgi:hypothetical protein